MKNFKNPVFNMLMAAVLITAGTSACNKNDSETGTAGMTVKMTDAPGPFDSVVVYIESVEVNNDSAGGWQTLVTIPGYYDLLRLQGNDTTLVNNSNLPEGYLHQMRLILADGKNYVVDTNGVKTALVLSSQDKNGLKLNLDTAVVAGKDYELLIDFDASKSIVETTPGTLKLKPVLKKVYLKEL